MPELQVKFVSLIQILELPIVFAIEHAIRATDRLVARSAGETTSRRRFVHATKIMCATCWTLLLASSLDLAHNMLIYVTPEVRLR